MEAYGATKCRRCVGDGLDEEVGFTSVRGESEGLGMTLASSQLIQARTTLKALSPSFAILEVLYHGEWAGRYYLVLSKDPRTNLSLYAWDVQGEAT
jgi:hypothetical protein